MKAKLIQQGLSGLRIANNNVYEFKYNLQKKYKMSKIVDLLETKIIKIPDYKNRTFRISTKFEGLANNRGWMLSRELKYNEMKNLETSYNYLIDSDLQVEDLKAQYFNIYVIIELIYVYIKSSQLKMKFIKI